MLTKNSIDEATKLMEQRLGDLDKERTRLERALVELGGNGIPHRGPGRPRGTGKATKRAPGRPRGSSNAPSAAKPARSGAPKRRKRRGGTRADQAVALIEKEPGISASDVAKTMKIKPNYLYRVLGDLEKEGRVKKDGRQYYPGG
jgi:hypothetical protein